jgi:nicotinamide mononucleotide (NMN) deamidase PncC
MNVLKNINGKFNLIGRLALTMAVTLGTLVTLYLVSGSVKAVEDIDLTDDTLAELSQFVAEGHASIRRVMATPGSSADAALVGFQKAVERRIARLRAINELVEKRAVAYGWTEPVSANVDVQQLEREGRAYLTAGVAAPSGESEASAMGLHYFDLRARKLMVTVSAMRDRTEAARAQVLGGAEEIVALACGFGALLIAYLIWYPVLTRRPQPELQ